MDTMKVLLANRPKMLRDLLREAISAQPDMEVVGEETDPVRLLLRVRDTGSKVVVVTLPESGEDPGICGHLLLEYPDVLVVAVSAVRDRVVVYRLTVDRQEIEGCSGESLVGVIRKACDPAEPQPVRKLS